MKKKLISLMALVACLSSSRVAAQSTPPVLINNIIEVDVSDSTLAGFKILTPGSNYDSATPPTITFTGGGASLANTATGTAVIDNALGTVTDISLGFSGRGYTGSPVVGIVGGSHGAVASAGASAEALLLIPNALETVWGVPNTPFLDFLTPDQNEAYGPAGYSIFITSVASGTHPQAGFVYAYTVNGLTIGVTQPAVPPGTPAVLSWTPPLPGVYSIVSSTSDGVNTAVSPAIRYFALGTAIVSSESGGSSSTAPGTLVPLGSAIAIQAAATVKQGFVKQVDFYTDWDPSTGSTNPTGGTAAVPVPGHGTLIGTSFAYPYNIIYTPQTTPGLTHLVKAIAWDNSLVAVPTYPSPNGQAQDQIYLTVAQENAAALPTSVIVSPAPNALVLLPTGTGSIQVKVSAGAGTGAPAGTNISRVELYVNGVLLSTDTVAPYNFNWTPTVAGVYSLTALSYDNQGNVVASTTSTTASNTPAPTFVSVESPPTVAITAPTNGASINVGSTLSVSATVSDTNLEQTGTPGTITAATVSEVQFFQDGVLLATTQTPTSPGVYQAAFTIKAPPSGTSQSVITAVATDSFGFAGTSPAVSVTVNVANVSGTGTSIVSPPASTVPVGSSVVVLATANPPTGSVVKQIDFYTNWNPSVGTTFIHGSSSGASITGSGTYVGTSFSSPYSVILTPNQPAGTTFVVKAVGWDNNGLNIPGIGTTDTVSLTTVNPVTAGLTCSIISPSANSLLEIPDYFDNANADIPVIVTAGAGSNAQISKVELYINGSLYGTLTAFPYNFKWTPQVTGVYTLTAIAYDNHGNSVASTTTASANTPAPTTVTIEAAPAVAITSPGSGGTLNSGATASIQAVASDTNLTSGGGPVMIQQVQFFQDGIFVGVASTPTQGNTYTVSFIPTQKINATTGAAEASTLTAIATDTLGFTGTSPAITVNVTSGGTGNNVVIGVPPVVNLTAPVDQANVIVNTPVTFAATAGAPNGNIASVAFLVDNAVVTTLTQYPYSTTYTFQNIGTYKVIAQVVDNVGDKTSSTAITVNVVPEPPPTVSITSPVSGSIISAGTSVSVTAAANSPSGTIAKVTFFENGVLIGTATTAPYSATFTPLSEGVYTLTAIATDNAGETTTSTPSVVEALAATAGLGTTSYFGQYQGLTEGGRFGFMVIDGNLGTYIGYSTSGPNIGTITFYSDIPVSSSGAFNSIPAGSAPNTAGVSGTASPGGISGNVLPTQDILIGTQSLSMGTTVASGYYTGNLTGQSDSQVTGMVGADGTILLYISSSKLQDVGSGSVDSSGAFSITTVRNNALIGTVDPKTGFLSGTLSGSNGGTILAARVSGGTFSDGLLRNISTRGQVGSGNNAMIAGFVVGGTTSKQLLVRAAGPTLTSFGLGGAIRATNLQIFSGTNVVASNSGWSSTTANAAAVAGADLTSGAFPFAAGSADSALVGTFAPGAYTAMVTGVSGDTGLALVEVYDLDTYTPFTPKKLVNISTRGVVGTGTNVMIGGFNINGAAPKRLLIRGAGPSLAALNVSGALATPYMQLINGSTQALIRENYSWQLGNDGGLVAAAERQTGAFSFAKGSADSAMLIVLPPGTYTVVLSGAGASTGTALVEIYEVP